MNWVKEYTKFVSEATESPTVYHFWSACAIIGASLKRNVWLPRGTWKIYPNLYVVLVGRPGIGKGAALNPAISIMKEAKTANIMSDRITIEYVLETMSKGWAHLAVQNGVVVAGTESPCIIFSPEFSVFVSASEATLPILTDLWDSREEDFDYGTRHKGSWTIKKPCLSMIAGSSPEWLVQAMPPGAVGGGFTRRVNFVYAKENNSRIPWPEIRAPFRQELVRDLQRISRLRGEFKFTSGARPLFEKYYSTCQPTEFEDEATAAYVTTKWVHALKLSMCLSASEGDSMLIEARHFQEACAHTEQCAGDMKFVFRAVGDSDMAVVSDKVLRFIEIRGFSTKKEILSKNWRHVSTQDLDVILATLTAAGEIDQTFSGASILYTIKEPLP